MQPSNLEDKRAGSHLAFPIMKHNPELVHDHDGGGNLKDEELIEFLASLVTRSPSPPSSTSLRYCHLECCPQGVVDIADHISVTGAFKGLRDASLGFRMQAIKDSKPC